MARLREKQVAMVRLLDRILAGKALAKRERVKAQAILVQLLAPLLAESPDAELEGIYDKHAPRSFRDEQQERMDGMRALAGETFDFDVEGFTGADSPEELAEWLDAQIRADRPEPQERATRKKSARALAREALREQTVQGGTRAVREVFRKLVSELHPDREADPDERARKTELMQRVNQAYKAGDLLTLLELQLSIEQIDPAALGGLAEDRLRHYIHVLEEQSRRLRDELEELLAPFALDLGGHPMRQLSPALIQQALKADIQEIRDLTRSLEEDLARFTDLPTFKRMLREYRVGPRDEGDLDSSAKLRGRRRRRAAKRG
jgi:hypothetical protein